MRLSRMHELISSEAVQIVVCRKATNTAIACIQKIKTSYAHTHQRMINNHDSGLSSQLSALRRHFGRERCHHSIASIKMTAASVGGE